MTRPTSYAGVGVGQCCARSGSGGLVLGAAILASQAALAQEERGEDSQTRGPLATVIFGSLEAGPAKSFAAIGLKRAVTGGLDASGFRTLLKLGLAREQAGGIPPRGIAWKAESHALIGHEWRVGDTFVSLYAGADQESDYRETGGALRHASRFGARLQGDLWATPTDDTLIQASAYVSSLDRRIWGRLAPGWLVARGAWLGPEIEAYRQRDYSKLRLGLHLTGLRLLGVTWRLSAGWEKESARRGQAYGTLGLHWLR